MKLSPKAKASLDKVVARFKAGDLSPIVEIAKLQLPADAPARKWTFGNRVLAYAQSDSLDCRGFKQWKSVGRHVVKGSRAAWILAPCTVKKETDAGEDEVKLVGFRPISVFAYTDTDGDPLPDGDYTPRQLPPLADVAGRLGVEVRWQPTPDDRLGDCAADGSKVNVGTHDQKTFFHELAHAVHARVSGGTLENGDRAAQEIVAEFTATVLMELYGYGDRSGNAWRYFEHYSKDPIRAIVKGLGDVEKILEVLEV